MGPVLSEDDLALEQLTDEDREVIRRMDAILRLDEPPMTGALTPEMCDEASKLASGLCHDLEKLEAGVEAYEESLVAKGHHPVHKESIRGDAS